MIKLFFIGLLGLVAYSINWSRIGDEKKIFKNCSQNFLQKNCSKNKTKSFFDHFAHKTFYFLCFDQKKLLFLLTTTYLLTLKTLKTAYLLCSIIYDHVYSESIVYSDSWSAYSKIKVVNPNLRICMVLCVWSQKHWSQKFGLIRKFCDQKFFNFFFEYQFVIKSSYHQFVINWSHKHQDPVYFLVGRLFFFENRWN